MMDADHAAAGPQNKFWQQEAVLMLVCHVCLFFDFMEKTCLAVTIIPMAAEFGWSLAEQGIVLAGVAFGVLVSQLPYGGIAVAKYGSRRILSLTTLATSLLSAATPEAASRGSLYGFLVVRVLLGAAGTAVLPAVMALVRKWIPEKRRGTGFSLICLGATIGAAAGQIIAGLVIVAYGWRWMFYLIAVLCLFWSAVVVLLIRNQPFHSPAAALDMETEGEYAPLEQEKPAEAPMLPTLRRLLSSASIWAIAMASGGYDWGGQLLLSWLPTYLHSVWGVGIATAGFLASLPVLSATVSATLASIGSDKAILRWHVPLRHLRIIFNSLGLAGFALCLVLTPLLHDMQGATVAALVAVVTVGWFFGGLTGAGYAINNVDVSPRHTALVYGISRTASAFAGVCGVYLTGVMVEGMSGLWTLPFVVAALAALVGAGVFARWGGAKDVF